MGRQTVRAAQILEWPVIPVGVDSDLEAAGNLIDLLDASEGKRGVILVNVAPRHKEGKKWENGTPFAYFHYKETLIVASISGLTLSLIKKFKIVDHVNLMDIPTVLESLKKQGIIDQNGIDHIRHTQFRSFEFLPKIAGWIMDGLDIPSEKYMLDEVPDAPKAIWWIDNFGNCKTTLTEEDIDQNSGETIKLKLGNFKIYTRLKDVPDQEKALIIGSSGLKEKRFLEIVIQGISASHELGITTQMEVI